MRFRFFQEGEKNLLKLLAMEMSRAQGRWCSAVYRVWPGNVCFVSMRPWAGHLAARINVIPGTISKLTH